MNNTAVYRKILNLTELQKLNSAIYVIIMVITSMNVIIFFSNLIKTQLLPDIYIQNINRELLMTVKREVENLKHYKIFKRLKIV